MTDENLRRKKYRKSVFIFRRDLRIEDNTGLISAVLTSNSVYCFFILDNNILSSKSMYTSFSLPIDPHLLLKRSQRRLHLLTFLKESLLDLQEQFQKQDFTKEKIRKNDDNCNMSQRLVFLFGSTSSIIKKIIETDREIQAIFVNRDYSPYSRKRDSLIKKICETFNIEFIECPDILINEPEVILNSNDKPFKVFSQYYNKAIEIPLRSKALFDKKKLLENIKSFDIQKIGNTNNIKVIYDLNRFFSRFNSEQVDSLETLPLFAGSREKYYIVFSELKNRHKKSSKDDERYSLIYSSSHLSPYLKFGLCSIREVYFSIQLELGHNHPLLRQLYWRDFFVYIGFHFPFVFNKSFQERYRKLNAIKWKNDPRQFEAWCNGKTGFPIVDAGMRELNETGFMHNRTRLITASFLVKDLHIDWRYGERYFALKLVDYDPSINNGNWQWVASTGCDSQPFFRIFNPWVQQKKFDPDCSYIKRWIPELREISKNIINEWYKSNLSIENFTNSYHNIDYPRPIVDHKKEVIITKAMYNTSK